MKKQPWIFIGNTFNRATKGTHVKMLNIATDTDSKLHGQSGDPNINPIYTDYHPVFIAYRDICRAYDIATDTRIGETSNVETLLKINMKQELPLWEGKIRSVYAEGTPQEKAYFPDGRTPFVNGTYTKRIEAVGALKDKLAVDPSPILSAYAPTVESFYNLLLLARETQVQKEGLVATLSTSRENQRLVVAQALYAVLARLMYVFRDDTDQVKNYFNLSLIREKAPAPIPADEVLIKGKVIRLGDGEPVANVPVTLDAPEGESRIKMTTATGRYYFKFTHLNPGTGTVTLKVDAAGYEDFEHTFEGSPGNVYTIDIVLTPAQSMLRAA